MAKYVWCALTLRKTNTMWLISVIKIVHPISTKSKMSITINKYLFSNKMLCKWIQMTFHNVYHLIRVISHPLFRSRYYGCKLVINVCVNKSIVLMVQSRSQL